MTNPQTVLNNRYQLEKQVGEGGFAKVFLAVDLQLDRQVAIKILSSKMAQDPEFLGRFKQEARAIANFEHPTILSVYDYGEFGGDPYLVMPFINGGTLQERLKQGPIPVEEAGRLLEQMSSALDYAHSRNMVHRDVKPQNMLIHSDGRLLLTDFGIAKLISSEGASSMTRPMGTISYMAPEQFDGHVSRQSDIYSLGVVLYQMLSGQLPFIGTTSQVLSAHYNRSVPTLVGQPYPQYMSSSVVSSIDAVIQRAMAKSPQDRFSKAGDFAAAYKAVLKNSSLPYNQTPAPAPAPAPVAPKKIITSPNLPLNPTPPSAYPKQAPSYGSPQVPAPYRMPSPAVSSSPAPKDNIKLFMLGGGALALIVLAVLLLLVLGGGGSNPPKPTSTVAAATNTAIAVKPATQAVVPPPTTQPATPTTVATNTPNLKLPEGYLLFTGDTAKLNLEMAYPKEWKVTLLKGGFQVDISDGTSSYTILRDDSNTNNGTIEEFSTPFIENLKKDGWKPKSDTSRYWGFAGERWVQTSYQKGASRYWALFALHQAARYVVVLTGEDSTFDTRLGNEFSKMFNTMHFLNTPVDSFIGEVKSYNDPKGNFILNYSTDGWSLDPTANPVTISKASLGQQFYIYAVITSSSSTTELLNLYKDKLANSGTFESFKETERYKVVNLDNDNQEQDLRFSYTSKGKASLGDLLIRKKGIQVYVGVALANTTNDLETIYFELWRYITFLK